MDRRMTLFLPKSSAKKNQYSRLSSRCAAVATAPVATSSAYCSTTRHRQICVEFLFSLTFDVCERQTKSRSSSNGQKMAAKGCRKNSVTRASLNHLISNANTIYTTARQSAKGTHKMSGGEMGARWKIFSFQRVCGIHGKLWANNKAHDNATATANKPMAKIDYFSHFSYLFQAFIIGHTSGSMTHDRIHSQKWIIFHSVNNYYSTLIANSYSLPVPHANWIGFVVFCQLAWAEVMQCMC